MTTAIFYDVENLFVGFTPDERARVRLAPFERAMASLGVSAIAERHAYGQNGHGRMPSTLKTDLDAVGAAWVETGGGYYGTPKNAADLRLMLDALELALTRPDIDTIVIVSGDGDFTTLVERLRSYGKRVVGVGYVGGVNATLERTCDAYARVSPPGWEAIAPRVEAPPALGDSRRALGRLVREVGAVAASCHDDVVRQAREVIAWFRRDPWCAALLEGPGLPAQWVLDALWYTVRNFNPAYLRSRSLGAFLREACAAGELAVVDLDAKGVRLLAT